MVVVPAREPSAAGASQRSTCSTWRAEPMSLRAMSGTRSGMRSAGRERTVVTVIAPSGEPSTENETREPPKDSTTERWKSSDARAAATAAGGCGMDC